MMKISLRYIVLNYMWQNPWETNAAASRAIGNEKITPQHVASICRRIDTQRRMKSLQWEILSMLGQ